MSTETDRHLAQMNEFGGLLERVAVLAVKHRRIHPSAIVDVLLCTAFGTMGHNGMLKSEAMRMAAEMWDVAQDLPPSLAIGLNQGDA